jgi:hypothetical protein
MFLPINKTYLTNKVCLRFFILTDDRTCCIFYLTLNLLFYRYLFLHFLLYLHRLMTLTINTILRLLASKCRWMAFNISFVLTYIFSMHLKRRRRRRRRKKQILFCAQSNLVSAQISPTVLSILNGVCVNIRPIFLLFVFFNITLTSVTIALK